MERDPDVVNVDTSTPVGDWWVMKARPISRLRRVGALQDAITQVGDPREETLGWVCKVHDIWDCPSCAPKVSREENPFR